MCAPYTELPYYTSNMPVSQMQLRCDREIRRVSSKETSNLVHTIMIYALCKLKKNIVLLKRHKLHYTAAKKVIVYMCNMKLVKNSLPYSIYCVTK